MGNGKDRIGVVLHLTEREYRELKAVWSFCLPDSYETTFDDLLRCRYLAVAIDGQWKAIAQVGEWRLPTREGGKRWAELGCISERVSSLYDEIGRENIEQTNWLTIYQLNVVSNVFADEECSYRPARIKPCLNLDDAAAAVGRFYGVSQSQVRISIHREVKPETPDLIKVEPC